MHRLQHAFDGHACWLAGMAGNNQILFAQRPGKPGAPPGRALRLLRDRLRNRGLGAAPLNRLLARLVVAWLAWRRP